MKKVLVICGTGVATSTVVMEKIHDILEKGGFSGEVELHQGKINDAIHNQEDYKFIISTTIVPNGVNVDVVDAVPLLTGIDAEEVYDKVLRKIGD
ncbi:PTS sugar transporter subunit IIB [Virgibacillus siamensis]|uniref:PTS sugar transporter subunit IIB n=1 Tax=Virgibacillus siamensis TaxID=480071 RepID=A0ABN1GGF5_9BACI